MTMIEKQPLRSTNEAEALNRQPYTSAESEMRAKEQVADLIARLHAFRDGKLDSFGVIFVNSEPHHTRQHHRFLEELGVEVDFVNLDTDPIRVGAVSLVKEVQLGDDDAPFSVTYVGVREESISQVAEV